MHLNLSFQLNLLYSVSSVQYQKVQKFEIYGDKVINVAEICKLLRDHDLLTSVAQNLSTVSEGGVLKISKDQVSYIVRLINIKNNNRNETQALGFPGFIELMPQLASFCWQKQLGPMGIKEMLQSMIDHNEKATRAKGQSTILYEDPDHTTIGDQDILKELNRKVRENPDYILPEGYYKVQEKEQILRHCLPEVLPIKESQRVAIEVLDSILSEKLGVHILEAIVTYESHYKVRPRIKHAPGMVKKEESGSAPALGFMKPIEKKTRDASVLKQLGNSSTSPKALKVPQGFQLAPIVLENQKDPFIKPKLGVDLKLEVIKLQQEKQPIEKQHIQDTAEVLEEILQATEQGLLSLPERQKIQAKEEHKNKALEDKEAKAKYDKMVEKQREEIRKKRHQALQEEIEKKKQEKLKQEEELKLQKEAAEKEKKVKQKRDISQAKTKDDQKRQLIDEAKRKKEEEKAQKKAEEEERKLIEKLRKQQDNKEFFKKQKQQLEQEFVKRRMEQEEAEKIKKEMEDIKKAQQEQVKNKMVNFMKQNKDHQRNEQQEWEQIQAFLNEPETQAVFNKYEKSFGKTFKHFAALDKKDMNLHSLQRISLQEFTKFGFQLKLIPRVATNEDFIHIFRALIREKTSTLTQKELDELGLGVNTLGLEDFKKAMIRIAILGQNRLPEDEWLLYKLPEWMAEGTSAGHKSVPQSTTNRVQKNIKIRGRSTLNSQGSQRRLIKQGSTAGIENEEGPGAGEISQTDINPIAAKKASVVRKTKEQKLIEELGKAKERQEKLGNIKIEDRKLNKAFDVSLVNSHTIDALLQYLQLQPNAHVDHHDKTNLVEGIPVPEGAAEEHINEFDPYNEGGVYDENGNPIEGDGQQAAQSHNDKEELERQGYDDNIVGPDGENEQWKMVE